MEEEGKFSNINDDQRGELLKQNQNSWYIPFSIDPFCNMATYCIKISIIHGSHVSPSYIRSFITL